MDDDYTGEFCPRCMIGRLQTQTATYARLYQGMVLSLPDASAYVCDYCGYQEFDLTVLQYIQALIGTDPTTMNEAPRALKTASGEISPNHESRTPKA